MCEQNQAPGVAAATYRLPLEEDQPSPRAAMAAFDDAHVGLWQQNARWFCRLRWGVVLVLLAAAIVVAIPRPPVPRLAGKTAWLAAIAGLLAVLNVAYAYWLRRTGLPGRVGWLRLHLWTQIVADLALLTAVIHPLGSTSTIAPLAYLFHVILACIFFVPAESLAVGATAAACYVALLATESGGRIEMRFWLGQVVPMLTTWAVIWYLASRLSARLWQREEELARTNARLQASAEERARHMLETTHQLKSPFAAIHANTQLLLGGCCGPLGADAREVIERIAARSSMLSQQILDMLQLANLRSAGQSAPVPCPVDLAESLAAAASRAQTAASLRGVSFLTDLRPCHLTIAEDHLRMLLENLLANAVNYSYDHGVVEVACRSDSEKRVVFSVRDHGIGIPPDKLPRVFDDFFRTREAVSYNRSSTGLGLAIVRQIARAWKMELTLESAPGWGTRCTVAIPTHIAATTSAPSS